MNILNFLEAYSKVCRMEYVPAEAPGILIPLLLGSNSIVDISRLPVFESLLIFILLYWAGFLINALTDTEVDRKYKTYVSSSVDALGEKTIKKLLIFHIVTAFLITIHLSYLINNYWILSWVAIATFFGLGYSVKPFHFKVRGVLHLTLAFSAMFAPFFLIYYVISGLPPLPTLIILVSLSTIHYGFALVNQSQDYKEDLESNLKTPAVRWGLTKTLKLAFSIAIIGLCIYFVGLYFLFLMLPNLTIFGYNFSLSAVFAIVTISVISGYLVPLRGIVDLIKISIASSELDYRMSMIKNRLNYPKWQFSGVTGSMIACLIFFILKVS